MLFLSMFILLFLQPGNNLQGWWLVYFMLVELESAGMYHILYSLRL